MVSSPPCAAIPKSPFIFDFGRSERGSVGAPLRLLPPSGSDCDGVEGKSATRCTGVRGPAGMWRGSCEASHVVGTRGGVRRKSRKLLKARVT
ncbi:hypothetical protein V6Z11_D11G239800 [Gossypium hirsutum]